MSENIVHLHNCSCGCNATEEKANETDSHESRRGFFKAAGALGLGFMVPPALANAIDGDVYHQKEMEKKSYQ